jgi:hypothetical protein
MPVDFMFNFQRVANDSKPLKNRGLRRGKRCFRQRDSGIHAKAEISDDIKTIQFCFLSAWEVGNKGLRSECACNEAGEIVGCAGVQFSFPIRCAEYDHMCLLNM